ncbi:hypothetical protein QGM71_02595 [Virgibacillus sp. C22-A2]|uniref:Uncharacterized protein n=1 Tax=Virgibacillus tibetensis TaxID=3042313 RepID=A0ABU6KC22_9BACI|nr:hypothetical protein [Virgibacillus sp. C22-A2]
MKEEKRTLVDISNVRIKEYDGMNVVVERYESVFVPKDQQTIKKWVFKGYSRSVLSALLKIQKDELLIDKKIVSDLGTYLGAVEKSNNELLEVVKTHEPTTNL